MSGFLVLEDGRTFQGEWKGGQPKAGEVVFNTSHSGYEEMATDPSYFSQILVATAPQQGNYGVNKSFWESKDYHIRGFIALELQESSRDKDWLQALTEREIPVITSLDTRALVLHLRKNGTLWGACLPADSADEAKQKAAGIIQKAKAIDKDWCALVTSKQTTDHEGATKTGPKIALIDYGCKTNILREALQRASAVRVYPCTASAEEILSWSPAAVLLSNGPGDPDDVRNAPDVIGKLLGKVPVFGICMGHQLLAKALGAKVYRLRFGHRGSNHPIKDLRTGAIYMTSQNHGYAVDAQSLPPGVVITHTNLNDDTVAGIACPSKNAASVQFHPESHPGPHEARDLFDTFVKDLR